MDAFFLLVFAVFTAITWWAFRTKVRTAEPLDKKISLCRVVVLWSLWLALIAGMSAVSGMEDEQLYGVVILGWAIIGVANLVVMGYAALVWSALWCWRAEKDKKESDVPTDDP